MEHHGITQEDIAERMETRQHTISKYKLGRLTPMVLTVEEWASVMGYRLELVPIEPK